MVFSGRDLDIEGEHTIEIATPVANYREVGDSGRTERDSPWLSLSSCDKHIGSIKIEKNLNSNKTDNFSQI